MIVFYYPMIYTEEIKYPLLRESCIKKCTPISNLTDNDRVLYPWIFLNSSQVPLTPCGNSHGICFKEVLRKILPSTHTLICHTDMRAGKIRDIQAHPKVAWHGWHPKKRVQLRLYGEATIDDSGELWAKEWNRIGFTSRTNYSPIMSPASPVSSFEEGTGTYAKVQTSTEAESEHWKAHFAVISTKIYRLEWLLLNREGHRRALFEEKQGEWEGKWLVP